jgi:hypothetical protein
MDAEKWRDGVGHDLAALAEASPAERATMEAMLLARPRSWQQSRGAGYAGLPPGCAGGAGFTSMPATATNPSPGGLKVSFRLGEP